MYVLISLIENLVIFKDVSLAIYYINIGGCSIQRALHVLGKN